MGKGELEGQEREGKVEKGTNCTDWGHEIQEGRNR